jgi:hypothetical protein
MGRDESSQNFQIAPCPAQSQACGLKLYPVNAEGAHRKLFHDARAHIVLLNNSRALPGPTSFLSIPKNLCNPKISVSTPFEPLLSIESNLTQGRPVSIYKPSQPDAIY